MKTLAEQINEVKNSKTSKTEKRFALAKLGLIKSDIEIIMATLPKPEQKSRFTYTFGVEIECLVPRREVEAKAAANDLRIAYEGYNHIDNTQYFKFVSDASIQGSNPIECVSPVLTSKDGFKTLENCCKTLNEAGARVNRSTGLHVHIATKDMDEVWYSNVFVNYKKIETAIDKFMSESRRQYNNCFCKSLFRKNLEECFDRASILNALHNDRYYKVNACSYQRHKTIEFRQHQGTTDFRKISAWVKFCAKLVAWSKTNRLQRAIFNIDEIPFLTKQEIRFFKNRAQQLA